MKCAITILLLASISFMVPNLVQGQQKNHIFQKAEPVRTGSSTFHAFQLSPIYSSPSPISAVRDPSNPFPDYKPISGLKKTLLIIATDFIRGEKEKYSIYSYDNSGTYPGPTIKYPQSVTEQELFLERYNRYTSDN